MSPHDDVGFSANCVVSQAASWYWCSTLPLRSLKVLTWTSHVWPKLTWWSKSLQITETLAELSRPLRGPTISPLLLVTPLLPTSVNVSADAFTDAQQMIKKRQGMTRSLFIEVSLGFRKSEAESLKPNPAPWTTT